MSEFTATLQSALGSGYALERELAGGGMSRVFVATDTSLGRKVVVKVLPPELAAGVNHERFRREIQVAAQLQHPHIVPLLSAGEQGALIWYTMPFINGLSLRDALARGDRFTARDVIRILREVAEGLDYAHGMGVIHRDIKPGNILLQGSHAVVTDFGVSKAISAAMPTSGYTSAGMAIGTPAYMAPEQIAADPAADHRMDLYALGLLGYELLTGKVPFKEASPQQTMAAQLTRDPEPIERLRSDVPPALATLIKRLLAKLPSDRPESAAHVVTALDAMGTSGAGESLALPTSRRSVLMRALVGTAAVAGIWAMAWSMGERQGSAAASTPADASGSADASQAVAPVGAMLTREDSMAIARAVAERMAARPAATPSAAPGITTAAPERRESAAQLAAMADSIRSEIQRSVLDSLLRMQARAATAVALSQGTPPTPATPAVSQVAPSGPEFEAAREARGPRRVVVALPRRSRADLDAAAAILADTLRSALDAHPRFVVVPADSVAAVLAESRTVNTVQERLNADLILSISLVPVKDSVVRFVQVRDVSGAGPAASRVVVTSSPLAEPAAQVERVVRETFRTIAEMDRTSRELRSMTLRRGATTLQVPPPPPRP